jgi:hypothetical protein
MSYIKDAMMNVVGNNASETYIKLSQIDSETANAYLAMIVMTRHFKELWRNSSLIEEDLQTAMTQGQELAP